MADPKIGAVGEKIEEELNENSPYSVAEDAIVAKLQEVYATHKGDIYIFEEDAIRDELKEALVKIVAAVGGSGGTFERIEMNLSSGSKYDVINEYPAYLLEVDGKNIGTLETGTPGEEDFVAGDDLHSWLFERVPRFKAEFTKKRNEELAERIRGYEADAAKHTAPQRTAEDSLAEARHAGQTLRENLMKSGEIPSEPAQHEPTAAPAKKPWYKFW